MDSIVVEVAVTTGSDGDVPVAGAAGSAESLDRLGDVVG